MKLIVEFEVPEDDDVYDQIRFFERAGDHPGLLEMAYCCDAYTARVEN